MSAIDKKYWESLERAEEAKAELTKLADFSEIKERLAAAIAELDTKIASR